MAHSNAATACGATAPRTSPSTASVIVVAMSGQDFAHFEERGPNRRRWRQQIRHDVRHSHYDFPKQYE